MRAFSGIFATISAHPFLSLLCFLGVLFSIVFLCSGGQWASAWAGLWRVFSTIFTTPFEFLRNSLAIIRNAKTAEGAYANTREFVLFRYSRIQYLTIFALAALMMSTGVAGGLVSLFPQAELEASRSLRAEGQSLTARIAATEQTLKDADKPGFRERLQQTASAAEAAVSAQQQAYAEARASGSWTGPILNQIDTATAQSDLDAISSTVEPYFSGCPGGMSPLGYNWTGWDADQCNQYMSFAKRLVASKSKLFARGETATSAREAADNASNAVAISQEELTSLRAALQANVDSRAANSPFSPRNIGMHLMSALVTILATAVSVIIFVWVGAIAIDVLNWIILIMRSLEAEHERRISQTGESSASLDRSGKSAD